MRGPDIILLDDDGFPRPDWSALEATVGDDQAEWDEAVRWWLSEIASRLPWECELQSNDLLFVLSPQELHCGRRMLEFATACQNALTVRLPGVARFEARAKTVLIGLSDESTYYDYLAFHFPDGHYGGSCGMHIREGSFAHIIFLATTPEHSATTEATVAHELVHAALRHLQLPLWVEEGIAQMFEGDAVSSARRNPTLEETLECRDFWRRNGLEPFWDGSAFLARGRRQRLAYFLAEILLRNLAAEYRPRWLGFGRQKQEQFLRFLAEASAEDAGARACEQILGRSLDDLTAQFIGRNR